MIQLVKYVDHMGSDLTVVNAARVSIGKVKTKLDEDDVKLINFLVRNNHKSPFYHPVVSVRVKCPIYVARQIMRHHVGISYNEISGRYVEFKEDFFMPEKWRKASPSVKQGSSDEVLTGYQDDIVSWIYRAACMRAFGDYQDLLSYGVCKEQARGVLPLATFTEFIMTASLYAWYNFYNERSKLDAQSETQVYAGEVDEILYKLFPECWKALTRYSIIGEPE